MFASPPTRLSDVEVNATSFPFPLSDGSRESPLPVRLAATASCVLARVRTKTSSRMLASPATRFVADDWNATTAVRPSRSTGLDELPFPAVVAATVAAG